MAARRTSHEQEEQSALQQAYKTNAAPPMRWDDLAQEVSQAATQRLTEIIRGFRVEGLSPIFSLLSST